MSDPKNGNTTTTALALATTPTAFEPANLDQALTLADRMSKSNLLPTTLRGKAPDVLIILMAGHEMGLSPMQAIRGMQVIEGRPTMSAELMVAQCLRHPAICESFEMVESTPEKATYEAKRKGARPQRLSFTLKEAQSAGLTNKDNWRKWPAAMLRARASGALARVVFPDLVGGIYSDDEADEIQPHEPVVVRNLEPSSPSVTTTATAPIEDAVFAPAPPAAPDHAETIKAILADIARAKTLAEVKETLPRIMALPPAEQAQIKPHYAEAVKTTRAATAPPVTESAPPAEEPPMPAAPEPGSEG